MSHMTELMLFTCGLLLSGMYSGAESAIMSVSVDRAKQIIEEGGTKASAFQFLINKPNEILTTILVGNNLVNTAVASLATKVAHNMFGDNVIAITVGVTTMFILIFGEIIPKTIGRNKNEKLAYPALKIIQLNYFIMYPIVKIFMFIIVAVIGKNSKLTGRMVTKNDIEFMVNKAEKEKSIDSKHIDLLNSILEFPTIKVKDIMVNRTEVHAIDVKSSFEELLESMKSDGHTRYPVYEETLDNTVGFLHVKDLTFVSEEEKKNFELVKYLKEPFFVYEHMKIQAVFDHMNRKKVHLALVKDENGLVVGIVTLEDIMEEIFGDIQDEHDDDEEVIEENSLNFKDGVVIDAKTSLRELYNDYDLKIPLNDNYSTLTGFVLERLGNNFPKEGHLLFWEDYSFELVRVKDNEILDVLIRDISGERFEDDESSEIDTRSDHELLN